MRRNDRAVTDMAQIEAFIAKEQILRVAFYDAGEIYIVPVNYGYRLENGSCCFYFHGAKAGRKYTLAQQNPSVGFEIDGEYKLLTSDKACGYSAQYQSIIGNGILSVVNDKEERIKGLDSLMRQLTGRSSYHYSKEMLSSVAVLKLQVSNLSCKAKF